MENILTVKQPACFLTQQLNKIHFYTALFFPKTCLDVFQSICGNLLDNPISCWHKSTQISLYSTDTELFLP